MPAKTKIERSDSEPNTFSVGDLIEPKASNIDMKHLSGSVWRISRVEVNRYTLILIHPNKSLSPNSYWGSVFSLEDIQKLTESWQLFRGRVILEQ